MAVKDLNTISIMFENELKGNLIDDMRSFISSLVRSANETIEKKKRTSDKVKEMESYIGKITTILDFMYASDVLDFKTYRAEYDRLTEWKLNKVSEIHRG